MSAGECVIVLGLLGACVCVDGRMAMPGALLHPTMVAKQMMKEKLLTSNKTERSRGVRWKTDYEKGKRVFSLEQQMKIDHH